MELQDSIKPNPTVDNEGAEGLYSDMIEEVIIKTLQKPEKPKVVTSNDKDLLISCDVSSVDIQAVDFFEVQWKRKQERRWAGRKNTDDNCTTIKIPITDLEKNTAYQFKVRWITQEGVESQFSDLSDDIIIQMSQKPGKPKGVTSNDRDLLISWDVPSSDLQAVDFFEIQWKKKDEKRWPGRKSSSYNSTSITIPVAEFDINTAYQFKVRWTTKDGIESEFSDISDDIMIKMSQKPGKPKGVISNNECVVIDWNVASSDLHAVDFFEIQWKKKDEKKWPGRRHTDDNYTSITIPFTELETNAAYQFKVRWTTKDGLESTFSEISDDVIIAVTKKPDKPKEVLRNGKELLVCWDVSSSDIQGIDFFEVRWKKKEERRWSGLKCTDDNSTSISIPFIHFEINATYHFKVKWTTKSGEECPFSEISDDVLINATIPVRSPQAPGKVVSLRTTATSAWLSWEKPEGPDKVSCYEVKYRSYGEVQWLKVNTKQPTESLDLKDLKSKNKYQFKVRAIFADGNEGPFSEVSDTVTTHESLAIRLKTVATRVDSGKPQRYKIPLTFSETTTKTTAMIRKGRFGGERDQLRPTKTIMVVGATGAGKRTLIDGMINYIVDVSWEDDFRFTITDLTEDEKAKAHPQAKCQTNRITCYEVNYQHGSRLDYNFNIIDIAGFGDTQGIEHDAKIVDQILTAVTIQGIDGIDAFCFVIPAPVARLTHTQKYIFDYILSLFGQNVKDNMFVLITFADGKEPPVLAALKEANILVKHFFYFNNSALFECNDSSKQFAQMLWKLGLSSFDNFFHELSKVQQTSRQLSTNERIKLQFKLLGQNVMSTMKMARESINTLEQGALKPNPMNEVNYVKLLIESEQREAKPGWKARIQILEEIKKKPKLLERYHMIMSKTLGLTKTSQPF